MAELSATSPIVGANTATDDAFWLNAAHQAVRRECGWHVAPVITETLVLDGRGGKTLLLPSQRVLEILEVLNDGKDVTEKVKYSRRSGVATLDSGWSCDVGAIRVQLKHGYTLEDAADVAGVIAAVKKRASTAAFGAVVEQSIAGARVRYNTGQDGGVLSVPLLESEKATLAHYKLNWGA